MKILVLILLDLVLLALISRAQALPAARGPLPEMPEAKACEGVKTGDVCPETGRRYYKDLFLLDEKEGRWIDAATTPGMLFAGAVLFGGTIADFETTQSCLARHTCQESNPLLGKSPSRTRMYAVGMPLDALLFYTAVKHKQSGHGLLPFTSMYVVGLAHIVVAAHNRSY